MFPRRKDSPDFGIIGFPKSGTSSLYVHLRTRKGIRMIQGEHPLPRLLKQVSRVKARPGDAVGFKTPNFIYQPEDLARLNRINPAMKIIVCLREPASWLYSFYHYRQLEITQERDWIRPHLQRNPRLSEISFADVASGKSDVLGVERNKGCFVQYLKQLTALFPAEQVHVVLLENLEACAEREYRGLFEFLEVQESSPGPGSFGAHNVNHLQYDPKHLHRRELEELFGFYEEHVQELDAFLNDQFGLKLPESYYHLRLT